MGALIGRPDGECGRGGGPGAIGWWSVGSSLFHTYGTEQWLHPSMSELASWQKCVYLKLKLKQSNSLRFAKPIIQVATFVMCVIAGAALSRLEDAAE